MPKQRLQRAEYLQRATELARRGEQITHAKLTERAVRAIRRNVNGWPARIQAQVYGVKKETIDSVRSYRTWRHVK